MRGVLVALLLAFDLAWAGCRQLAGIEDIRSSANDAGRRPDSPTDSSSTDEANSLPVPEAGFGCDCPTCTTLAMGLNAPASLALVGSFVYFLNYGPEDGQGSLMRVSTSGVGSAETVIGDLTRPFSIASDSTHLYWQAEDGKGAGTIVKLALSGGAPETLASGLSTLQGVLIASAPQYPLTNDVAVTNADVYFVGFSGGQQAGILHVPIDGGVGSVHSSASGQGMGGLRSAIRQWLREQRVVTFRGHERTRNRSHPGAALGWGRQRPRRESHQPMGRRPPWRRRPFLRRGTEIREWDVAARASGGRASPDASKAPPIPVGRRLGGWLRVLRPGGRPGSGVRQSLRHRDRHRRTLAATLSSPVALAVDSGSVLGQT